VKVRDPNVKALLEAAKRAGARVYSPRIIVPPGGFLTLETVLTHPDMFGLESATPVQRAICRALDGLPLGELWNDQEVRDAFGGVQPVGIPKQVLILAGIRSGKSLISAARLVQSSQNVNLKNVSVGDRVLSPCLSVDKKTAEMVFNHAIENILAKPALRALLVGDPQAESFVLRHPSGKHVTIQVTAVSKHGSTLVGAWLAGLTLDEAPRMSSAEDGVRNMEDSLAATRGRILAGATTMLVGSPWQPFGLAYELYQKCFGVEGAATLVIKAPGPAMNPSYWTPEQCEEVRKENEAAYDANVLANFADQQASMFSSDILDRSMRTDPEELEYDPSCYYYATMDPATRSNHWAFVILTRGVCKDGKLRDRVVLRRVWKRSAKENIDADAIFAQMAVLMEQYKIQYVTTDQWALDVLAVLARRYGISLIEVTITRTIKSQMYERARTRLADDQVELPPDPKMREELLRVRKITTKSGYDVSSPILADGSHGDLASALVLGLSQPLQDPYVAPKPLTILEKDLKEMQEARKAAIKETRKNDRKRLKAGKF
jgi:hypothetical protein